MCHFDCGADEGQSHAQGAIAPALVETYFNTVDYHCGILAARAAELRTKSEALIIFDAERIKYAFAAKEIEKLIEKIKAL